MKMEFLSLVRDKLVVKEDKVEEDMMIPSDIRVAQIIKQIADKISPFITVTVDCPQSPLRVYASTGH